jgi:hypothetical protein
MNKDFTIGHAASYPNEEFGSRKHLETMASRIAELERELAAKNAVVEALRKDKSDFKAAMEHYAEQVYGIFGDCK